MEAVPRLPMLSFDLKTSPEPTSFGPKLKQYIRDFHHEDPEMYTNEIHALEGLRAAAVCAVRDVTGCSTLKRYYCQLHFLQGRFPMAKDGAAAVPFTWRDTYASMVCTLADIRFEMVAILYNIGALHSQLGASDSRVTADGMKMSCTHFQCAAWAFQHLKDTFPQPAGVDLAPDVMQFMYHLSLAQAQECILEKSMMDNRKATIIAKVAVQIVDYYNLALNTLEQGASDDCSISETVGSKIYKNWKRYVKFKIAYHTCVSLLYQGQQAEEQQKMGERVAYYQAAAEKLEEAVKLSKGMDNAEMVNECLTFTHDVVEGKKKAAKNENEFIYHEEVPDRDILPDVKGASLVKGIPFNVNDPEVSGADIFARLVPMKAHEASSLYSEEKAKLLRRIGLQIDEKDEELVSFMTSLQLENLNLHSEPSGLPQELVDRCAALSAKPNAIQNLIDCMNKLADTYQDVEAMMQEIKEYLQVEELKEKEYQDVMGKRPPSIVATDLTREANKYQEAHNKASESNQTLHKAMTLHISNLRILSQPLAELQKQIPTIASLDSPEDEAAVKEMKHIVGKVEEMKRQRAMLATQLRESICQDDITRQLVTRTTESLENVFSQEMQKHQRYVSVIEQNLAAQENILKALTDAYARCAGTRKAANEIIRKREATVSALISSYDAYEDLLAKSTKGLEFYRKLETNVSKLLQRVKGTCKVQEEERDQILAKNKKLPVEKTAELDHIPKDIGSSASGAPRLKDYLQNMKRTGAAIAGYGNNYAAGVTASFSSAQPNIYEQGMTNTSTSQWVPPVRPAPVGSEAPGEQSRSSVRQELASSNVSSSNSFSSPYPTSSLHSDMSSFSARMHPSDHLYSYPVQQQPQAYSSVYAGNPNFNYATQYPAVVSHGNNFDPTKAYAVNPHTENLHEPTQCSVPDPVYVSKSSSFQEPAYQQYTNPQAYQQPGYSQESSCIPSYDTNTSSLQTAQLQQVYPLNTPSQVSQPNAYSQVNSYTGQPSYGAYQYNTQTGTCWQPQVPENQNAAYYSGEFHAKSGSSTSVSSVSLEVPFVSQPQYYPSSEYQYMPATAASCYTNAGKYVTSQTCSSQTSVEGHTYAAQYNSNQGVTGYQAAQGCYYSVPYGYQYPEGPLGNNVPSYPQQQQTPQSPMTYMQARDPNQQTTNTTTCHGGSALSSSSLEPASSSNVDLLAGLDFSINQAPLTPVQTSVASEMMNTVQMPVKEKGTSIPVAPSEVTEWSNSTAKCEVKVNNVSVTSTVAVQPEILSKLEVSVSNEEKVESKQIQKLSGKDPYSDPEVLNQFVQEVEKYEKFVAGLTTKTLNGPTPLDMKWKELLDLQEKDAHKRRISVARCYPMKNRFPDILPYDHSRVELPSTKDDYINASYVKELTPLSPPFIMTQAPLPSTYTDFWTMVHEQQVEVLVCLLSNTELMDQTYWPQEKGQELVMGKMKLTLQSCNVRPHWVERILSLSILDMRITHVIIHLQFTSWPGSSFPASPGPFLNFVSEALNFYRQQRVSSHPVVVHCLSGVGRSGLFCLVAAALLDIQAGHGLLDLVGATVNMSSYRKGSLRDREHLKFAYQAVLYFAQDLLMKRGILTSCSTFDDKRSRGGKSHTRHPSEDFLLGPPTDLSQLQSGLEKMGLVTTNNQSTGVSDCTPDPEVEKSSSCDSSGRSSPYQQSPTSLLIDPTRFSLKPDATSCKARRRYTRENFSVKTKDSSLVLSESVDPLSQLDPMWSLKKN